MKPFSRTQQIIDEGLNSALVSANARRMINAATSVASVASNFERRVTSHFGTFLDLPDIM
jgi:hypothetical protein